MRLWSVKTGEPEVFTHLQGEALEQARDISTRVETQVEVWTLTINDDLSRGEILAACLNHNQWGTESRWATNRELLSTFVEGKKLKR